MFYHALILSVLHFAVQAQDKVEEATLKEPSSPSDGSKDGAKPFLASPHMCCSMDELKDKLSELIVEQREASSGQTEVIKVLRAMKDQGAQHLSHLQNLARHQSLLLENHQALLQQVSRIATHLQDMTKRVSEHSRNPA